MSSHRPPPPEQAPTIPPAKEAEGLPAYVARGRNKRSRLVFWKGGAWHASNWAGPLGDTFASRDGALAALENAPSRPKPVKLPAAPKLAPNAYDDIRCRGDQLHVYEGKNCVGAVYLLAGQFAAWDASGHLLGKFNSADYAEAAVLSPR
jgi:hypothetical protein